MGQGSEGMRGRERGIWKKIERFRIEGERENTKMERKI